MICLTTPGSQLKMFLAVKVYCLSIGEDMVFDFHFYLSVYILLYLKDTKSMATAPFFFFKRALANVAAWICVL